MKKKKGVLVYLKHKWNSVLYYLMFKKIEK